MFEKRFLLGALGCAALQLGTLTPGAQAFVTSEPSQLIGNAPSTPHGWTAKPLFTVGETIGSYRPVGILDGIGATRVNFNKVRILVNHELGAANGYPYTLANGTTLTGARISFFDIHPTTKEITAAGLAYDTVVDRAGVVVTAATQINEGIGGNTVVEGFDRFCAASLFEGGSFGLVNDIYFAGEEVSNGGQECALDVHGRVLYVVPALGRQGWENVTMLETGDPNKVAILTGDDRQGNPLWLYIGTKNAIGDGSFLDRNGLARGDLYGWKADNGDVTPQQWNGTASSRMGTFVLYNNYQPTLAGTPGWDSLGYATQANLDAQTLTLGTFRFSRPEDLATNPADGAQAVFASTGRGSLFPADNWGDTIIADFDFSVYPPKANLTIVYDGDDAGAGQFSGPDFGLRSPDNLDWADNGKIYIQEDRSTTPGSLFGGTSGIEASMWELDPVTSLLKRVGVIDRTAVPTGQTDPNPADIGNWESSGVVDITSLVTRRPGETVLLLDVQGHNLTGPPLGAPNQSTDLVEGGQLLLLSSKAREFDEVLAPDGTTPDSGKNAEVALRVMSSVSSAGSAELEFDLPQRGAAELRILDVTGRVVRSFGNGDAPAGTSSWHWDGRDASGASVHSGVYFAQLKAAGRETSAKVLVVR